MNIKLKHVKKVRKILADGTEKIYFYHQRTLKRIRGEPGSFEFLKSYEVAKQHADEQTQTKIKWVIAQFENSPEFLDPNKSDRTRYDYSHSYRKIEAKIGNDPISSLNEPEIRQAMLLIRNDRAKTSRRQADALWAHWHVLIQWALNNGYVSVNHFSKPGKLYNNKRTDMLWMPHQVVAFMEAADKLYKELQLAMILGLHTGQRQKDLLILTRNSFDGYGLRIRQSKGGREVYIPCTEALCGMLNNLEFPNSVNILNNKYGKPWSQSNFQQRWREVRNAAGVKSLTFHDLRGTCVTILSEQGCTPQEIASITGHSYDTVTRILETYAARTLKLSETAIAKLEASWVGKIGT